MTWTATQAAKSSDVRKIDLATKRCRVVVGEEIIGQFSNIMLADQADTWTSQCYRARRVNGAAQGGLGSKWLEKSA
jgi:hypothetical protein